MPTTASPVLENLSTTKRIGGLTHGFYRYPATTSPELVREIIGALSHPGDLVLDPFMGGGTTVVEALATGRKAIGMDINELAVFIARTKTTPLSAHGWDELEAWASNSRLFSLRPRHGADARVSNFPDALGEPFGSALRRVALLSDSKRRNAARCSLLRVGQWALESRETVPGQVALQERLIQTIASMRDGMDDLVAQLRVHGAQKHEVVGRRVLLHANSRESNTAKRLTESRKRVRLVLTSPPYPGVHVLYHRWQVRSRRETAAPYWIADRSDGFGPAYYTLGGRSKTGQVAYFEQLTETYRSLRPLLHRDAVVAQIVAFADAKWQLPAFLEAMEAAGYEESTALGSKTELVRAVPNRRWYARSRNHDASREFVILHSLIRA